MSASKFVPVALVVLAALTVNCGKKDSATNKAQNAASSAGETNELIGKKSLNGKADSDQGSTGKAGAESIGGCLNPADDSITWHYASLAFPDVKSVMASCEATLAEDDEGNAIHLVYVSRK